MKNPFFLLFPFLFVSLAGWAKVVAKGEARGVFQEISWGDYPHFVMTDKKGNEIDFFCTDACGPFMDAPKKFEGKKVRVRWQEIEKYIPEAGGVLPIREAVTIELIR